MCGNMMANPDLDKMLDPGALKEVVKVEFEEHYNAVDGYYFVSYCCDKYPQGREAILEGIRQGLKLEEIKFLMRRVTSERIKEIYIGIDSKDSIVLVIKIEYTINDKRFDVMTVELDL